MGTWSLRTCHDHTGPTFSLSWATLSEDASAGVPAGIGGWSCGHGFFQGLGQFRWCLQTFLNELEEGL